IDAKFPENMAKAVALGFSETANPSLGRLFLGGIEMPAVPVLKPAVQSPPAQPIWGIKFMPANHDCFFHGVSDFVKGDMSQAAAVRLDLAQYLVAQTMKADFQELATLTKLFEAGPDKVNDGLLDAKNINMSQWLERWDQLPDKGQNCGLTLAQHIVLTQFTHERQKQKKGEAYRTEEDDQTIWGDTGFMLAAVSKL